VNVNKSEVLLLTSSFLSYVGNGMHYIALTWLLFDITKNPTSISIFLICTSIPYLFTFSFSGVLSDIFNKKKLAILLDILRAIIIVLIISLYSVDELSSIYIYILTFLLNFFTSFFHPSFSGLIKFTTIENRIPKIIGANSTVIQLGTILGTGLSGFIISNFSILLNFYVDLVTYIVSAVLLIFIKYTDKITNHINEISVKSIFAEFKEGMHYVFRNEFIIFFYLIGFIPNILAQIINSILAVYTSEALNLGAKSYGALDASYAIGATFVGILLTIREIKKKSFFIPVSYLAMSISFFILFISKQFIFSFIALLILGLFITIENISRKSLIFQEVSHRYIGRVESFITSSYFIVAPLSTIISSIIVKKYSSTSLFLILSLCLAIIYIYIYVYIRKFDIDIKEGRDQI
jgi:DHA3 family macrolide efflux protein-like MFS transporter